MSANSGQIEVLISVEEYPSGGNHTCQREFEVNKIAKNRNDFSRLKGPFHKNLKDLP